MYASNVSIIVTSEGFEYFINFIYFFINYNFTNFTIFDFPKVMTTVVVEVIRIDYITFKIDYSILTFRIFWGLWLFYSHPPWTKNGK